MSLMYFFPSQSSTMSYFSLSKFMRWSGFSLPLYFTPKYSTTWVKHICCHFCFHNPGVSLFFSYLYFDDISSNNFCARSPDFGSQYIFFLILAYTHPSLIVFSLSSYYLMTSYRKMSSFIWMYSYHASGLFRFKSLISSIMDFYPRVEIMLLSSNLTVIKLAVVVS